MAEGFNSYKKKQWIVRLLAICCLAATLLLVAWTPDEHRTLRTAAEVDSLIHVTLNQFSIPNDRVRTRTVQIDSVTERRVYMVDLPRYRSKTEWHYELDKRVRPFRVKTPAQVHFPERDLEIHLTYGNTVIRTVHLRTDPDSKHPQSSNGIESEPIDQVPYRP